MEQFRASVEETISLQPHTLLCRALLKRQYILSVAECFQMVTSPVNMPDPIRKRFGYGQLWPIRPVMANTASVQHESGRIVYAVSDYPHPIQFRFFPKKAWTILCKTDPDPIWMAW